MVKRQAWSDAVSLLMRFGEACDKGNAYSSQAKAYLGAIVVWLYAGNVQQAWQVRNLMEDRAAGLARVLAVGLVSPVCYWNGRDRYYLVGSRPLHNIPCPIHQQHAWRCSNSL